MCFMIFAINLFSEMSRTTVVKNHLVSIDQASMLLMLYDVIMISLLEWTDMDGRLDMIGHDLTNLLLRKVHENHSELFISHGEIANISL